MDQDRKLRGVKRASRPSRAPNKETWVNAPLQNTIRHALDARDWSISDLGRAIGSQPSLISRWMMGATPNPRSTQSIAEALGLDVTRMMVLAGHLPDSEDTQDDERLSMLVNKLKEIEITDDRFKTLNAVIESMRMNAPS